MALSLNALLQTVAANEQPQADLTVTGRPNAAPVLTESQMNINPQSLVKTAKPEDIAMQQPLQGLPEHKGMFGVKGTLRDVLGTIGDALLIGSGNKAIYRPVREQEKISDALVGYGPGKEREAIARVMARNPEFGAQLYEKWQNRLNDQTRLDNQAKQQEVVLQKAANAARIQKARLMPNLLAAAKGNPDQQAALKVWYADPQSSIEDLDPEVIAAAAINPYQQAQLKQGDERIDIAKQNADANTKRANRPPAGRAAPQRTKSAAEAEIVDAVTSGRATPGQQKYYDEVIKRPSGRRGSGRGASTPPPSRNKPNTNGWKVKRVD